MFDPNRKLQLLEKMLKTTDDEAVVSIESILNNATDNNEKLTIKDFIGVITEEEAEEMKKAIEETCERIDTDDWK
jgi:hypothetical protein